jgi:hypothetical protein
LFDYRPQPKPTSKRRVKKTGERSKFSKMVRDQVKEHYSDTCQMCGGHGFHVHHVMPRARSGRNVFTNALLLCNGCHKKIHADNELLKYWIEAFKKLYGPLFFMDLDDLKEKYRTQDLREQDREVREWKRYNDTQDYKSSS